jgi:2,3-bisphosphoglycerate-independent phosphoglycerate mutase
VSFLISFDRQNIIKDLSIKTDSKIVLLVMDGVGDLPNEEGKTPLKAANKPIMDSLAKESELGQSIAVFQGITPGSGPGHLSLFGYDPLKYQIGEEVEVKVLEINLENENKRGNMVVSAVNLENFEGKEAEDILKDLEK